MILNDIKWSIPKQFKSNLETVLILKVEVLFDLILEKLQIMIIKIHKVRLIINISFCRCRVRTINFIVSASNNFNNPSDTHDQRKNHIYSHNRINNQNQSVINSIKSPYWNIKLKYRNNNKQTGDTQFRKTIWNVQHHISKRPKHS